jgi:hypothetical protein
MGHSIKKQEEYGWTEEKPGRLEQTEGGGKSE